MGMANFTFKREKLETGLAGVGYPYPNVQIKHKKKVVGMIYATNWQTKDHKWGVHFTVEGCADDNHNCPWHWIRIKERFDSEELARQWVKDNAEKILSLKLHEEEPDDD